MSVGLGLAVAAVIIDSIVTCFVGWRLNKTARQEATKAAETLKPALQAEMEKAALVLLPLIVETLSKHFNKEEVQNAAIRALPSESKSKAGSD